MRGWLSLIQERFSPTVFLPMILLFTGANALWFRPADWDWCRFVGVFFLVLSFFLRLRIFDEIKDHATDLVINPTRPLARGALSITQAKHGLLVLILFELLIVASLGSGPFFVHTLAIFYSLMMYEEFFLSNWLRLHLTTYAVTHTFVSVLLGASAATAMAGEKRPVMTGATVAFFLMNWGFFNLFEFARKTFAPAGERPGVDSYSKNFGLKGAVFLAWSQALLGVALFWSALGEAPLQGHFLNMGLLMALYFSCGVPLLLRPSVKTAALFQKITGLYLLLHYALVILILGWR